MDLMELVGRSLWSVEDDFNLSIPGIIVNSSPRNKSVLNNEESQFLLKVSFYTNPM